MKSHRSLLVCLFLSASLFAGHALAKQGSTDPLATSNGATNSGGTNSGKINNTVVSSSIPNTTTTNTQPFVTATLAFSSVAPVNGSNPVCSGDYHIDPYYSTLSLATVNVDMTGVSAPDGTAFHVNVYGSGGTLYPFTSNALFTSGGIGLCSYSLYVTPGTVITSVDICDASGQVIATGK